MLSIEAKLSQLLAMEKASEQLFGSGLARLFGGRFHQFLVLEVSRNQLVSDTLDFLALNNPAHLKRPLKVRS